MENFEPGIQCPWTSYTFSVNDYGRKCLSCGRVITLNAWQEKGRCYCGNTFLIEAVARASTPTRIPRTTTSSSKSTSSTTYLRSSLSSGFSSPSYSSTNNTSSPGWGYLALLVGFILIVFGTCTYQSNKQSRSRTPESRRSVQSQNNPSQNYPSWNFPRSECGDSNLPGLQNFYRVYVNRTDDSTLRYIRSNYCRDAYLMTRTSVNRKAIQVASFRSKEKAFKFSQIMLGDPRINSAEVGSPSQH